MIAVTRACVPRWVRSVTHTTPPCAKASSPPSNANCSIAAGSRRSSRQEAQCSPSFYAIRVLLGAAEAGFFPGIIFYLTLWFPAIYRARIIGWFMVAIPLSTVLGAPVSSALLGLDGVADLKGRQWLFVLEAVPALILSVVA
jgi:MFS family permease